MTNTIDPESRHLPAPAQKRGKKGVGLSTVQVGHLILLLFDRHEEGLPNDKDGREALYPVVACARHLRGEKRVGRFADIRRLAPWATPELIDELELRARANAQWYLPSELGAIYGVTKEERHRLKTWQLAAIDETAEELKSAEAKKGRERARRSRLKRRANRPAKISAADRRARLLEELPNDGTWIEITKLIDRVRHLPEFTPAKDLAGVAHKDADWLKAHGRLVDDPRLDGRRRVRWVRRARDSDRTRKAHAPQTAPQAAHKLDRAAEYMEHVGFKLRSIPLGKDGMRAVLQWFKSSEEASLREQSGLTTEQLRQVTTMVELRLGEA